MKKLLLKYDILVSILCAIIFATSYPPFKAWALFFCFAPLWVVYFNTQNLKRVALLSFINQFVFTFIGFNWVAHTAIEYGHIPIILSYLILIGFCFFASLNVLIASVLAHVARIRLKLNALGFFIVIAVLSSACEWFYPRIFSWNLGYPLLFSHFQTSQLAEYFGFSLLSLGVSLANGCFALAIESFPQRNWSRPLVLFILALFVSETSGTYVSKNLGIEDKHLNVLLVQPNIGNYEKLYAERGPGFQAPVVAKDIEVTEKGLNTNSLQKPDLIVWPETAYPAALDSYFHDQFYPKKLLEFARKNHTPMIVGAFSGDDPKTAREPKDYNAVFAIGENGEVRGTYRKHVLLAFGEYFPGAEYFPFLKKIIPEISDFGRGVGPTKFDFGDVSFEPMICYEGLDTGFVGESIELNPHIFVNVTNDSWFGKDFEPYQHMIMTIARNIEYRRPMIRATNTGLSIVADARGQILMQSPQNTEWAQAVMVPYFSNPKQTFYSKIVAYLSPLFLVLVILSLLLARKLSQAGKI
jgi:apolipoprotein N-acyltransferase